MKSKHFRIVKGLTAREAHEGRARSAFWAGVGSLVCIYPTRRDAQQRYSHSVSDRMENSWKRTGDHILSAARKTYGFADSKKHGGR